MGVIILSRNNLKQSCCQVQSDKITATINETVYLDRRGEESNSYLCASCVCVCASWNVKTISSFSSSSVEAHGSLITF